MATSALFVECGMPIPGREARAIEVFFSAMQFWGKLQQDGKIEAFRSYGFLTGDQQTRSATVIIEGSDAQIAALRESEAYRVLWWS